VAWTTPLLHDPPRYCHSRPDGSSTTLQPSMGAAKRQPDAVHVAKAPG
jgi:hypothetical protein